MKQHHEIIEVMMKRMLPFFLLMVSVMAGTFQVRAQSDGKRTPITAKNIAQVTQLARLDVKRDLAATSQDLVSVGGVAVSPDGSLLASGNGDATVTLWDVKSGQPKASLKGPTLSVNSVAFSPDGSLLASASNDPLGTSPDPQVWLWDVTTGQPKASLQTGGAASVTFSPNGSVLAYANLAYGTHRGVQLWDVKRGKLIANLRHDDPRIFIGGVAFSPDGSLLAIAGIHSVEAKGIVELWDVKRRSLIHSLIHIVPDGTNAVGGNAVAFSPDGSLLASGSDDDRYGISVRLWDVKRGKLIAALPDNTLDGAAAAVTSVAFSPDGSLLAAGEWEGTVRLWDVKTMHSVATLQGHMARVNTVAFSPDRSLLVSGSDDGTVRLWGIPAGSG